MQLPSHGMIGLQTIAPEIRSSVFENLTVSLLPEYQKRPILNAIYACKQFYAVGLPHLYHEVCLKKLGQSFSFFIAIYQFGHLVRRIRIEDSSSSGLYRTECHEYKLHRHIIARDRLVSILRFCPNLGTLPALELGFLKLRVLDISKS